MLSGADAAGSNANRIGIVVIGRNEGDRLVACLESLRPSGYPVVYVDSGSHDSSVGCAARMSDQVVELSSVRPFSAARARNEGFAALRAMHPAIDLVQFIDGDCTLIAGWLEAGEATLAAAPRVAVTVGALAERCPEASIYNRLCALEWKSTAGEVTDFGALGGIMMVRAAVFADLRGFDEHVIAGEDSEFGVRVHEAGFKVLKLGAAMATHDADIHRFGQWWRRAVRSGHAVGQRFGLHGRGPSRDCARRRRSVVFWAFVLPATIVVLAPLTYGSSLLLALGYVVMARRVANYRRAQGDSASDARLYARFNVLSKFAEGIGLLKFHLNRMRGRYRIIEYK